MKKTLTINLSGVVFNIDEDAYEILNEYLRKLEIQFSDEDGKEVMRDIEARLAELFSNTLKSGNKNVVTINNVNSVIEQLGTAEEIGGEGKNSTFDNREFDKESRKRNRKFYRDGENKILGGVAAGLAAYLGLEVTITRLIMLLLAITVLGWLIPIYLVVWVIAPEATTTAQKLEMQGIEPSIENMKSYLNSEQFRESASRVGSRLGEVVKWLFRIAAIIVGLFFAFIGVVIIGALTIALIGIITGVGGAIFRGILPIASANTTMITFIVATLVALLIPIVSIIMATIRLIRRDNTPHKSGWGWMWFVIWIIAVIVSINTLLFSVPNIVNTVKNLDENGFVAIFGGDITTEERLRNEQFTAIEIDDALVVQLIEDTCCFVEVRGNTNTLRNIKTTIEENTLKLELRNYVNNLGNQHGVSVHYCSEINKIEMGSASVISSDSNRIKSNDLEIDAASASVINLGVDCKKLDIEASSAAVLNIWGETDLLNAELSSAAVINFKDLVADSVNIEAASGSIIDLPKTENIKINKAPGVIIK